MNLNDLSMAIVGVVVVLDTNRMCYSFVVVVVDWHLMSQLLLLLSMMKLM